MIRRLIVPGAAAVVLMGALTGTAAAAPAADNGLTVAVDTATAVTPGTPDTAGALPTVSILKGANGPRFTKSYVSGQRSGRVKVACRRTNASFVVANRSPRSQTLTVNGRTFVTVPSDRGAYVCGFGSSSFSATFHLARNSKATLHATFR